MAAKKTTKRTAKKTAPKKAAGAKSPVRRWSAQVMKKSDAMDLKAGVFTLRSSRAIALSLKKSAERSKRRKSTPFRSAMSMLNFEINRGGRNLTSERKRVLNGAKQELRKLFERPAAQA
jgi:hypothetical protein